MPADSGNKRYSIEEILEKTENLSFIPTVVADLMEKTSDPEITVHEVTELIRKDQGLVAQVFKVANSSFYGRLKKAENLTDAVITLGLRGLKSFVITQAVKHVLTATGMDTHSLWKHAIRVSDASLVLAKELQYNILENVLVGGLVHDIGKAFIENIYPGVSLSIDHKAVEDHIIHKDAERIILGFDHTEVGALITEKWNFPHKIVEIIRYHHTDDIKKVSMESHVVIGIVKIANAISRQHDDQLNSSRDDILKELNSLSTFVLTTDQLQRLLEEIKMKWGTEDKKNWFY
jgi:putative nucleotidyltransferase with HDIG domain